MQRSHAGTACLLSAALLLMFVLAVGIACRDVPTQPRSLEETIEAKVEATREASARAEATVDARVAATVAASEAQQGVTVTPVRSASTPRPTADAGAHGHPFASDGSADAATG